MPVCHNSNFAGNDHYRDCISLTRARIAGHVPALPGRTSVGNLFQTIYLLDNHGRDVALSGLVVVDHRLVQPKGDGVDDFKVGALVADLRSGRGRPCRPRRTSTEVSSRATRTVHALGHVPNSPGRVSGSLCRRSCRSVLHCSRDRLY